MCILRKKRDSAVSSITLEVHGMNRIKYAIKTEMGSQVRDERGSVTIYLVIVFLGMLLFIGLFIDLGRIKVAQNQLRRVTNASARSVLANYNVNLKDQFGLFAVDQSDYSRDFEKYLQANFITSGSQNFNLFDYRYERGALFLNQPLKNTEVLKQQILEDTKYSAPIEITRDLLEKFKSIGGMANFFNDQTNKTKDVKNINNKIKDISDINRTMKTKRERLKNEKSSLKKTNEQIEAIKSNPKRSEADSERLKELEKGKDRQIKQIGQTKDDIQQDIGRSQTKRQEIQAEIDKLEKDSEELKGNSGNNQIDSKIQQNMEDFKKENIETLKNSTAEIQNNIESAGRALDAITIEEEVAAEAIFSRINIDSADKICEKLSNPDHFPSKGQDLKVFQDVYKNIFTNQEQFANESVESEQIDERINNFGNDDSDKADVRAQTLNEIFGILNFKEMSANLRNEIYINEYALTHFSYLTSDPKGGPGYNYKNTEVEYILYGDNPKSRAVAQLYATRFALDTLAYFIFSPEPPELISKTVFSLLRGAIQASVDTYKLLADGAYDVAVVEMYPPNLNSLNEVRLNYKDHLRLFLLLAHGEEKENNKLNNILSILNSRSGIDSSKGYTLLDGSAEISIKMWFLPLAGIRTLNSGPFETKIVDGRCYITKSVEFGY
ncbi:MAG: hypothetical protein CVV03_07315 [Firmicutes bacterium HGW-Firmicutes-8]|nr:MAG: hypothetical protein CVV03_07315 [Firmicutes bacterium HGW-Firmicutes-8]